MGTVEKLTAAQVKKELKASPLWSEMNGAIQRTFEFPDFVRAMEFVSAVARQAEADQHHPDILIRYNKVTLTLTTHDAGGLSKKDFDLARKSDGMAPPGTAPGTAPGAGPAASQSAGGAA
jgi:4a-hydroxytetrahydrobiopterin dehydratase